MIKSRTRIALVALAVSAALASAGPLGGGDTETFLVPIPDIGETFFLGNGIIPGSNDFNGGTVIDARLELVLNVFPTEPGDPRVSSAEWFESEILVPVDLDPAEPGAQIPVVRILGSDEGWSGTGEFTISRTLDDIIGGVWTSPLFYSASTYDGISQDEIVLGSVDFFNSFVSVTVQIPAPGGLAALAAFGTVATRRRR
jgi:hypothetical protein